MAKTLIILILLFDGTLVKEKYDLARPMEVHECLMFGDDHREAISTYDDINNRWWLKDESGNAWFGSECIKE